MGCVQSQDAKSRKLSREEEIAIRIAEQQRLAAEKANKTKRENHNQPRRETDVLRRATAFDKLDEDAHKSPSLRDIQVVKGAQSQKLLQGFEEKEAQARAKPELIPVEQTDLRNSKLYAHIRGYEEKDEKVKQEPKLEKTFIEREKERELQEADQVSDSIQLENALLQSTSTDMDSKVANHLIQQQSSQQQTINSSQLKERMKSGRRKARSFIKKPAVVAPAS